MLILPGLSVAAIKAMRSTSRRLDKSAFDPSGSALSRAEAAGLKNSFLVDDSRAQQLANTKLSAQASASYEVLGPKFAATVEIAPQYLATHCTVAGLSAFSSLLPFPLSIGADALRWYFITMSIESQGRPSAEYDDTVVIDGVVRHAHMIGQLQFSKSTYASALRQFHSARFPVHAVDTIQSVMNSSLHKPVHHGWAYKERDAFQWRANIGQMYELALQATELYSGDITHVKAKRSLGPFGRRVLELAKEYAPLGGAWPGIMTAIHMRGPGAVKSSSDLKYLGQVENVMRMSVALRNSPYFVENILSRLHPGLRGLISNKASNLLADLRTINGLLLPGSHLAKVGDVVVVSQHPNIMPAKEREYVTNTFFPILHRAWMDVERATGYRWDCTSYLRNSPTHSRGISLDIAPSFTERSKDLYAVNRNSDPVLFKREKLMRDLQAMKHYPKFKLPVGVFVENDHIHLEVLPEKGNPNPSYGVMKWGAPKFCYPDTEMRMQLPLITTGVA